jgi:hypothetical protein
MCGPGCIELVLALRVRSFMGLEFVDKRLENHKQGWRIGIMRILYLELGRYFATSLVTKNLFAGDPTILINKIKPTLDDLEAIHQLEKCVKIIAKFRNTYVRSVSQSIIGSKWKPSSQRNPRGKKGLEGILVNSSEDCSRVG